MERSCSSCVAGVRFSRRIARSIRMDCSGRGGLIAYNADNEAQVSHADEAAAIAIEAACAQTQAQGVGLDQTIFPQTWCVHTSIFRIVSDVHG